MVAEKPSLAQSIAKILSKGAYEFLAMSFAVKREFSTKARAQANSNSLCMLVFVC